MKRALNIVYVFVLLNALIANGLVSGCASTPDLKIWQTRVNGWVPVGTSKDEAYRVLNSQGFDCTVLSTSMTGEKFIGSCKVVLEIYFENGRVRSPPKTSIQNS